MSRLRRLPTTTPVEKADADTVLDITDDMVERAAEALMVEEAQACLTDIYGHVSRRRAETFARAALKAALDTRRWEA
jgi:hypothetical protein